MEEPTFIPQCSNASKASLSTLPTEIKLMIIDTLAGKKRSRYYDGQTRRDLKNLSHCSKLFYSLCFRARILKTIILTPKTAKLFMPGGLLEYNCGDVRSIKSGTPPALGLIRNMLAKSEIAISWLRTELQALPIFPNVKYLTIEYEIPSALERITFFAILKGLPPLQSVKYLKLDIMIHYKLPNKRYQQVYPELSKNTKQFLGGEIHSDMVEAYTMEHLPNPTFPILRELSLWVSRVGIAELDSGEPHLTEKGFYHLILMAAPETESFYLKTIDLRSRSNTHPIFEQFDQEAVVTGSAPPDIICPKMNLLTIETDDHRLACAFENVAKMFPNLTEFEIMLSDGTLHTNQWGFELYRGLMGLKQLENIVLPWPRDVSGLYDPEALAELCLEWRKRDLHKLETVQFLGETYRKDRRFWRDISIEVTFSKTGDGEWDYIRVGR